MRSGHLIWGKKKKNPCQCNSTAGILAQLWPPEVLLPLRRTSGCSPSPCGERGGAAPGSSDPILSICSGAQGAGAGLSALFGSLCWLQSTPILGLCSVLSPHTAPSGEHTALGARHRVRNIVFEPLGGITNPVRHKK